jgi:hypothetical protein
MNDKHGQGSSPSLFLPDHDDYVDAFTKGWKELSKEMNKATLEAVFGPNYGEKPHPFYSPGELERYNWIKGEPIMNKKPFVFRVLFLTSTGNHYERVIVLPAGSIAEGQTYVHNYPDLIARAILDLAPVEAEILRTAPYTTHILRYDTI